MASFSNLDELVALYPDAFDPSEAEGMDAVIQLDIAGDDGGRYFLEIQDQEMDVTEGMHDDPTVTVQTSAENWLDIHRGEASAMSLMMTGQLTIQGSMSTATKFQDILDFRG